MNLSNFEITTYSGLYLSKDSHPKFGKKYIARFQHDKKRYVKVLGYTIKDKLSDKNASELMQKFKDSIVVKTENKIIIQEKKLQVKDNEDLIKLKEENDFFKSILGNYQKIKPEVLAEGIQKIHDLDALKKYQIELIKLQNFLEKENIYEPIGDIEIIGDELNGVEVVNNISWLIDELPALSIAMSLAKGKSTVRNAKELRVKESDRIKAVVDNLALCGVDFTEFEDGYEIRGGELKSATIDSYGDHRIAMSFAIAGLNCDMKIDDVECINSSFPNFKEILDSLY